MTIAENPTIESTEQFAREIRAGLCHAGQKTLPSKYLYNPLGSMLFEAISLLPEYGLTRAEERILRRYSREIVQHVPKACDGIGTRQWQRQKNPLDAQRPVRERAALLLSD